MSHSQPYKNFRSNSNSNSNNSRSIEECRKALIALIEDGHSVIDAAKILNYNDRLLNDLGFEC